VLAVVLVVDMVALDLLLLALLKSRVATGAWLELTIAHLQMYAEILEEILYHSGQEDCLS
jgi:hypothetical protein